MRLAGSNKLSRNFGRLDGSAKIKPAPTKEMTAAEIVELKKLLDCPFYRRAFKGVNREK